MPSWHASGQRDGNDQWTLVVHTLCWCVRPAAQAAFKRTDRTIPMFQCSVVYGIDSGMPLVARHGRLFSHRMAPTRRYPESYENKCRTEAGKCGSLSETGDLR